MKITPVKSSNIEAIGHDPVSQTLHVKFKNGSHYTYEGVSAEKHNALDKAESVGKHLNAHIIGKHKHTKCDKDDAGRYHYKQGVPLPK